MVNETLQILTLLIGNQEEAFSIRKISRLRDINYKSAYKAVHALEQKGLARLQRIGNTIACSFTQKFDEMVFHAESMRRDELLRNKDFLVLRNRLDALPFPFIALLFGSYAKERQTGRSDIDFLVAFKQPTYDNFIGLSRELENLFGKKVEILTPEGLDSIRVRGIAESIRKTLAYA